MKVQNTQLPEAYKNTKQQKTHLHPLLFKFLLYYEFLNDTSTSYERKRAVFVLAGFREILYFGIRRTSAAGGDTIIKMRD